MHTTCSVDGVHTTYNNSNKVKHLCKRRWQTLVFGVFSTCGNLRTAALKSGQLVEPSVVWLPGVCLHTSLWVCNYGDVWDRRKRFTRAFCVRWDDRQEHKIHAHTLAVTLIQFTFVGLCCMLTLPRKFLASECPYLTHACVCVWDRGREDICLGRELKYDWRTIRQLKEIWTRDNHC